MVLRASLRSVPVVVTAFGLFLACGNGNGGGAVDAGPPDGATCQPFVPPSSFDPSTPAVSFTNDVLPIFAASCSLSSSCHNSTDTSPGGIYLGEQGALVYSNLVNVAAVELPTVVRIKPGDPAASYLLHRIDGDACAIAGCASTVCNELMPQGGPQLDEAKRLTIRAWIAQGARSDLPDAGPASEAGSPSEAGPADASGVDGGDASTIDANEADAAATDASGG